jgi:2-polyprenyl-3-methyl-5-hydroxy-6-metoxy-1,4-benzoquinol methylase
MMSIIKKRYDKNYFENISYREIPNSQRNINRLKEILKYKKNGKLFEVGCAKCEFLKLATKHFNVEGIDISTYAINSMKSTFDNKINVKDIEKVNLTPNYYDIIVIFNVLEHLKEPHLVIKKLKNSLKKDGIIIGSVPNNFGLIGKIATQIYNAADKTHCSVYPLNQWCMLLEKTGFKKITFFGEIVALGRNSNMYIKNGLWKYVSFNLMFLCNK